MAGSDLIERYSPDEQAILAWFTGLSFVNQFAAGANPRSWAEAQTQDRPELTDEFERRAKVWARYMEELAGE